MRRRHLFVAPFLLGVGCSSTSSGPAPFALPAASIVVDDSGPVKIRREAFIVNGVTPPPNPNGNQATPADQNKLRVVRYRVDSDPPKPARAIVVMTPGFLGGAGGFDDLARAIVRRSADGDALEAWAIDRRSNLLEDTWGEDVAEVKKDPSLASSYYFDQETVEGKSFAGFLEGAALPWMSEWGIATAVGDLREVLKLVPDADRGARVVLLGHSLGASIVEEYAAWDFAGTPGYKDIAALALLDGVAGNEGSATSPIDQPTYENGGGPAPGGVGMSLGVVKDIRNGNTYFTLPFLGIKVYAASEYLAMRARWTPTTIQDDSVRDGLLGVLLGVNPAPKMTNRAAFGFAFDDATCPLAFASVKCGSGNGGAITPYMSVLGAASNHPSDPNATYGWTDYDQSMPVENTSVDEFARGWYEGPGMNFAEWYFPQRLVVDANAASTLNIADGDWRATAYGLRAKHGAEIDVPIFAMAAALVGTATAFDALKAMVAPIGAGRPSAGKPRTDPDAFTANAMPDLTHLDGIAGADVQGSRVAIWYDGLVAFARKQTPSGGVAVPVQP